MPLKIVSHAGQTQNFFSVFAYAALSGRISTVVIRASHPRHYVVSAIPTEPKIIQKDIQEVITAEYEGDCVKDVE